MDTFGQLLEQIVHGEDLSAEQAESALEQVITGEVPDERIAAFLFGMRQKGETVEELTAFVNVMREASVTVDVDISEAVDLCGTGGDHSGTFNISTAAMFVVAGAGVPVLKHGNRSVSSKSGSADVLEALGIQPDLPKKAVEQTYSETQMAFMFAPNFHPAMKHVMPARRTLAMRTFFNILGPLLNPAGVKRQVIGAFNRETAQTIAQILSQVDTEFAYTVNAHDGLDEFSVTTASEVFELNGALVSEAIRFQPEDLDIERAELEDLQGGDADYNAQIITDILRGKAKQAQEDIVALNAAFGIQASGQTDTLKEALDMARESIASGAAEQKMKAFAQSTQEAKLVKQ
jgi:anthranilate phosphoribosyltransferase